MKIYPARINVQNVPLGEGRELKGYDRSEQLHTFQPPPNGLVTAQNLNEESDNALILENFRKTVRSIAPRGGSINRVKIPTSCKYLFEYTAGTAPIFFAANDTSVYRFTEATPSGSVLSSAEFTGQTGSDYVHAETQNAGGKWLHLVNGVNYLKLFDGTIWRTITDVSAPHAITGVDTRNLCAVWNYNSRLFFAQKASLDAWYLGVNAISGAASKIPLGGIFRRGGGLGFGATISGDSGDGSDDRCVFVTDRGEFAVYAGNNPGDPQNWRLQGVYDLGEPLGRNAHFKLGGDLMVATKQGLLSLGRAMTTSGDQLIASAMSRAIQPDWNMRAGADSLSQPWQVTKDSAKNVVYITPSRTGGEDYRIYVLDLETASWSIYTGWAAGRICVMNQEVYFGTPNGTVFLGDVGGLDDGKPFECRLGFHFRNLGRSGSTKFIKRIQQIWRSSADFISQISVSTDFKTTFKNYSGNVISGSGTSSYWDIAEWDIAEWGGSPDSYKIYKNWTGVFGIGMAISPQIQIISASAAKLNCELVALHVACTEGGNFGR